ncbi:dimethylaniline monooxygenase [Ktedonosporobacter rubrisoli]|uniref:Dimethylaniline monooxygenase n=1 Tax=Ktedonosporobacter rubrisoli TaxID=2509675 RepID=A0A4P6K4K7_KTERU|nr:NAD(P)-binding domain-containing protein [Ktedonosporobacter rubrisoli]QBD83258.1 dimethylaniline monooxygenase [Ktedonosporobacter rubrisoli]
MTLSLDQQEKRKSASATYDAVVVGAGPYGLSMAAHLLAQGLKVAILGKPLSLWRENMPEGMLLRSFWWASNLSAPEGKYSLGQYLREQGLSAIDPLSRETFIAYGTWFQRQAVPMVDETYVAKIENHERFFTLELVDGRVIQSTIVVMAPGLYYYTYRPNEYNHLSAELVSHTCDHPTLDQFGGKRVVVVGGGQSALESAALLYERGIDVRLIARRSIFWLSADNLAIPYWLRQLRSPKVGLGYGWINWALEQYPYVFQQLPRTMKDRMLIDFHGPAGAWWLRERIVGKLPVYEGRQIEKAEETDYGVQLRLSDHTKIVADHLLLATGYRADIRRLPMLSPQLIDSLQVYMGSPVLNSYFESNVPGLYFVGFTAARSAGPFYRFVVGAQAASRRVAASVARSIASRK